MDATTLTSLHDAVRSGNVEHVKTLLNQGVDVDGQDPEDSYRTALLIAAKDFNVDLVKLLLAHGANPNIIDQGHMSPLAWVITAAGAAKMANPPDWSGASSFKGKHVTETLIKELLAGGADVNWRSLERVTVLVMAVMVRDMRMVNVLAEGGANVNAQEKNGKTALHFASYTGDINMVKYLLSHGADINVRCNNAETALHIALKVTNGVEVAKFLVDSGADVNARETEDGLSPLHTLVLTSENISLAKKMIARNAEVDVKENQGRTPLSYALSLGALEIADLLIKAGGDVNSRADDGSTALHRITYKSNRKHVTDGVHLAKALIARGADLNARNSQGYTALILALGNQELGIARCLIKAGADVNCRDENNISALHLAALHGNVIIVRLLLDHGVDLDARSYEDNTALHLATMNKKKDVVKELLSRGADTSLRNENGHTPSEIAFSVGASQTLMDHFEVSKESSDFEDATFTKMHLSASRKTPEFERLKTLAGEDEVRSRSPIYYLLHGAVEHKVTKKSMKKRGEIRNSLQLFCFESVAEDEMFVLFLKNQKNYCEKRM